MDKTPYTLLVLGGTSAIAMAYVHARLAELEAEGQHVRICLAGRNSERLEAEGRHLKALGAQTTLYVGDLSELPQQDDPVASLPALDEVVLAYGALTDQSRAQKDEVYLRNQLATNFTSAALWLERLMRRFEIQGHGRAIVIGSVAGDRGRQSNYIYGASKAGLAALTAGLQHRYAGCPDIYLHLVKPGFVKSPMTDHLQTGGLLWSTPEQLAQLICKRSKAGKLVSYAPWFWYFVMFVIRNVPSALFHRTKL